MLISQTGVELSGKVLAWCAQGPEFSPQHPHMSKQKYHLETSIIILPVSSETMRYLRVILHIFTTCHSLGLMGSS